MLHIRCRTLTGAWIEIFMDGVDNNLVPIVAPSRVRGLKYDEFFLRHKMSEGRTLTGAWIEISYPKPAIRLLPKSHPHGCVD